MQVTDFLQRVKSQRFPSIEKDMKMVLSHCGSLLLDSAALCQVTFQADKQMIDGRSAFQMACCTEAVFLHA